MAWFTRKQRIAPRDIAEILHEIFVREKRDDKWSELCQIPQNLVSPFRTKVTLYREALILMILLSESQRTSTHKQTVCAYEELVLGPSPSSAGLEKLDRLKAAMADLDRLIHPGTRYSELSWSSEWLSGIGHREYNPARTALFAVLWTSQYRAVIEAMKKLKPSKLIEPIR
jgi:hypothetical protein